MDLARIKILVLDVDGVLTDGRIFPVGGSAGRTPGLEGKAFGVQDGMALTLWRKAGGRAVILSGRSSAFVELRARELGLDWVLMSVSDKAAALDELVKSADLPPAALAYVGDDLPDLAPMRKCGFAVAVANAVPAVKRAAAYVTRRPGGQGAVAEVVELLLRKQRRWGELARQ